MHESLPNVYRPKCFLDLIGQELNARFLSSLILHGQLGRNIIFYGPFGSSKTTSMRLYAKALNCLSPTSVGSPCGKCTHCVQFEMGGFPDYLEVDAASNGDKESIGRILELIDSPPMEGKYRVIAIDEVQQITKAAWDRLLRPVEETPSWLVFLFSTTELEKVRPAIQSRCQCLSVNLLGVEDARRFLKKVAAQESIEYEAQALDLIIYISKGHPRDLLKNLEQVATLGAVTLENVKLIFNLGIVFDVLKVFEGLLDNRVESFVGVCFRGGYSPSEFFAYLKQLCLFLTYKYISNVNIGFNSYFSMIPSGDLDRVWGKFLSVCHGQPETSFGIFIGYLSGLQVYSEVELELHLVGIKNFIHTGGFNGKAADSVVAAKGEGASSRAVKGRRFVTLSKSPAVVVGDSSGVVVEKEVEVECSVAVETTRVYPHTLLKYGFRELKSGEGEVIVLD